MSLDNLPGEIIDLIAHYILLTEVTPGKLARRRLCSYTDDDDPRHRAASLTTNPPFPAGSSVFDLASVSRYTRNVLFLSRDSRYVKVPYVIEGRGKAGGISPSLLASVDKLRLVSRKRPLDLLPETTFSSLVNQGIGDILLSYHYLSHLEIDWHLLPLEDPRLAAMEACANAIPVMKFDLRCSRACTLLTVGDLHIRLGAGSGAIDSPRAEMMGQQLDLIFQQFDLPALRTLHFSHDFTGGNLDMLNAQWKKLLPAIRLQYWPYLEAIQICVVAPYHYTSREGPPETADPAQAAIWRPLVKDIVEHLATYKKPLDVTITLHWKFHALDLPSPFKDVEQGKPEPVLREQIMPTAAMFDEFVQELKGRTKDRPFSLQFMATCRPRDKEAKRLLKATYRPDVVGDQASSSTDEDQPPATTYQIHQGNIARLKETLSQPDPDAAPVERPAAEGALTARRLQLLDLHRRLAQRGADGEVITVEMLQREVEQTMPVVRQRNNVVRRQGEGEVPEDEDEGDDGDADDRRGNVGRLGGMAAFRWLREVDDDDFA